MLVTAIHTGHQPRVNEAAAFNSTVSDVYAHMSAMKGGRTLKIPQFARECLCGTRLETPMIDKGRNEDSA